MNDDRVDQWDDAPVTLLERVVSVCDQFESDWRAERRPSIEAYLASSAGAERLLLFERLLGLELELRRRAGQSSKRQEYLHRFPEFATAVNAVFADDVMPPGTSSDMPATPVDGPARNRAWCPFEPGRTVAGYEIVRRLGAGGMGEVFEARQVKAGDRTVALKCIRPEALGSLSAELRAETMRRFQTEARAVASLRHPNLVTVFDVGDVDGWPFFSMQFVDGGSLAERLRSGPLPDIEAAAIIEPVARAVHEAHRHGILHRDLKPGNIVLDAAGRPYVADFGLAKELDASKVQATATRAELGTPPYMSPEQARGKEVDVRTDVYGLGATLYHALTGRAPFQAPSVVGILNQVTEDDPVSPRRLNPAVSRDLETVCLKCLSKRPADRYPSAEALADDLGRFIAGRPVLARRPGTLERTLRWAQRKPAQAIACALGILVLLLGGFGFQAARRQRTELIQRQRVQAQLDWQATLKDVQTAQILLSTQTRNQQLLDQGSALGRTALGKYGIGQDDAWMERPQFSLLSAEVQLALRREFGELLLLLARAELLRGADPEVAAPAALAWNVAAEQCIPDGYRPRWLSRQRGELLALVPGGAQPIAESAPTEIDAYHDGLEDALRDRHSAALAKLIPFSNRHPNHFMSWFARGVAHQGLTEYADAAAAFSACTALQPEMPWPLFNRGLIRLSQGRNSDAEKDFSEALRLKPDYTFALFNRAIARKKQRNFEGAEEDLTAALAQPDAPARVLFVRSEVREERGNKIGAAEDAAEGFRISPNDPISWCTRGYWLLKKGRAKEALADFDEALKFDPYYRDAIQSKAATLGDYLNQPKEAAATMDRLLEFYPRYIEARASRGVYLARAGEVERAKRDAADSLAQEPTPYRYFQMAGLYAQLSRHEKDEQNKNYALQLLARAFHDGFADWKLVDTDKDLDPIRGMAEFQSIVKHARPLKK